jgi:protein tyrosine kinase modulator
VEPHFIQEFLIALLRELSRKRLLAVFALCASSLAVLCVGLVWPLKYETSATLYVDEKNIIQPLLKGQAEVQDINQALEAKEKIYTRRILEKVATEAGLLSENADSKELAQVINQLSGGALGFNTGIQISSTGKNYINLSYKDADPETSFNVINALIGAFMRNIAESKRIESRGAFDFIESQVEGYKQQLKQAEERLKNFNADNRDGTENAVRNRIATLQADIQELRLSVDELDSHYRTISHQMENESAYLNLRSKTDVYRQRIQEAQTRLDNMLISLTHTHPDVINLTLQIEDHKQAIVDIERREAESTSRDASDQLGLNPLYEELRSNLAETEIKRNAARHRRKALGGLLEQEYKRLERVAARQAQLAELTRDYTVTKELYEDMLSRREKARLSMTLDIEGQGISYKIHEPPTFPLEPTGLNIRHFMVSAPLLGIMVPIGLIGIFIFLDPRIRLPSDLAVIEGAQVLAISPPLKNAVASNTMRKDTFFSIVILAISVAVYAWIAITRVVGAN